METGNIQFIGTVDTLSQAWGLECAPGACVFCKDTNQVYICDGTAWKKIEDRNIDTGMSLYSLNQSIISQLAPLTDDKIDKLQFEIQSMANKDRNDFHMLLCNELHYYTILQYSSALNSDFINIGQAVTDLLYENGWEIICYDKYDDRIEIWGKKDTDTHVFMFFPYDRGVVTHG